MHITISRKGHNFKGHSSFIKIDFTFNIWFAKSVVKSLVSIHYAKIALSSEMKGKQQNVKIAAFGKRIQSHYVMNAG